MAKVLLVEDDINLREIYAARLVAESYQVAVASDGEEALAKAVSEKPNLIILDIMMPKISGFDVLDILRSTPATKKTKVIMLTALSQSIDRQRGEKLGVDKYLVKSQITLEDVVNTVKELLTGVASSDTADNGKKQASQEASAIDGALKNLQDNPPNKQFLKERSEPAGATVDGPAKPPADSTNPSNNTSGEA